MHPKIPLLLNRVRRDWEEVSPRVKRTLMAIVIGCMPVFLIAQGVAARVEPLLLNRWFAIRGEREVPKTVTIVRIDKRAYDLVELSLGEMFPRERLAQAIDAITATGAKLILLDGVLQRPGPDPEIDRKLAQSLENAPIVIGKYDELLVDTGADGTKVRRRYPVTPIPLFAERAKGVVSLEVRPTGGVVREISLSNAVRIHSTENVPLLAPVRQFVDADAEEPGGNDFINYYGGPTTISSVSLAELITPGYTPDPRLFKGRVVLIGIASEARTGIAAGKDTFATPISSSPMYGVEIHATIAANLIDRSWIRRLPLQIEGIIMGTLAFLICYAMLVAGPLPGLVVGGCWFAVSYVAFLRFNYFLPGLTVFLTVLSFAVICLWGTPALINGWRERRAARELQAAAAMDDTLIETSFR